MICPSSIASLCLGTRTAGRARSPPIRRASRQGGGSGNRLRVSSSLEAAGGGAELIQVDRLDHVPLWHKSRISVSGGGSTRRLISLVERCPELGQVGYFDRRAPSRERGIGPAKGRQPAG